MPRRCDFKFNLILVYKHCSKKLWRRTFEVAKTAALSPSPAPSLAFFIYVNDDDDDVDVYPDATCGYTSGEYLDANVRTTFTDPPGLPCRSLLLSTPIATVTLGASGACVIICILPRNFFRRHNVPWRLCCFCPSSSLPVFTNGLTLSISAADSAVKVLYTVSPIPVAAFGYCAISLYRKIIWECCACCYWNLIQSQLG
jgi:hypothetical protein